MTQNHGFSPIFVERRVQERQAVADWSLEAASLDARGAQHRVSTFSARVRDVSLTGMRILANATLRAGQQHWFRIDGPADGAGLRLRGEVAWTHRADVGDAVCVAGIAFLAMTGDRAEALRRWLRA